MIFKPKCQLFMLVLHYSNIYNCHIRVKHELNITSDIDLHGAIRIYEAYPSSLGKHEMDNDD